MTTAQVKAKLEEIRGYVPSGRGASPSLVRMAKLGVVIDDWMAANDLVASALQCWTSVQKNYRRQRLHADEHDERPT